MPTYYDILQVRSDADSKTIKAAHRTLMFKCRCHPDLGGSESLAKSINEAYHVLINSAARKKYNETLLQSGSLLSEKDNQPSEKRRIVRIQTNLMVSYRLSEKEGLLEGRLADLSSLGCRLQTSAPVKKDDHIFVTICDHTIQGIVRWNRMFHPHPLTRIYEAGIEFLREFEEMDKIREYPSDIPLNTFHL